MKLLVSKMLHEFSFILLTIQSAILDFHYKVCATVIRNSVSAHEVRSLSSCDNTQ